MFSPSNYAHIIANNELLVKLVRQAEKRHFLFAGTVDSMILAITSVGPTPVFADYVQWHFFLLYW
jgi:hypothetical protein